MNYPIEQWYKASDGSAAVDMQVALITPWQQCGPKETVSFMGKTPDGPIGEYTIEFSNAVSGGLTDASYYAPALLVEYPSDALASAPEQPAGTAVVTGISVQSLGEWCRAKWTPTSGSESESDGILPTSSAWSFSRRRT